jgi:hypothetical protein
MALFNKIDMTYKGYQWTAYPNDNAKVTGNPDSTRFNRHEGYEVLYLINTLANGWNLNKVSDCQKMEKMIHKGLPSNAIMQIDVKNWIEVNWGNY